MIKVKMFEAVSWTKDLEPSVNGWLRLVGDKVKIISTHMTECDGQITYLILYDNGCDK